MGAKCTSFVPIFPCSNALPLTQYARIIDIDIKYYQLIICKQQVISEVESVKSRQVHY